MTIENFNSRWDYVGDNIVTSFGFDNLVVKDTDLRVYLGGVLKTIVVDYTVTGAGTDAGTVDFLVAPGVDVAVAIIRETEHDQLTAYPTDGPFPSSSHEAAMDKLTIIAQEDEAEHTKFIGFNEFSLVENIFIDDPVADALMTVAPDGLSIIMGPSFQEILDAETAAIAAAVAAGDSAAAALASEQAAAAIALAFDKVYLGSKAADPLLDNQGAALSDGALYFDTTLNVLKFYDLGGAVWKQTTPTVAEQAAIDAVVAISAEVQDVAAIDAEVVQVAAIDAEVVVVANDAADIGIVAGDTVPINVLAPISADISAVASVSDDVSSVASQVIGWLFDSATGMVDPGAGDVRFNDAVVADVTALAISDINDLAADVGDFVNTWGDSTNPNKGTITVYKGGDSTVFAIFTVTGLSINAGWSEVAVTFVDSAGAFADTDQLFIGFSRAGNLSEPAPRTIVIVTDDLDVSAGFIHNTFYQVRPVAEALVIITIPDATTAGFINGYEATFHLDLPGSILVDTPSTPPVTEIDGAADLVVADPGAAVTLIASTATADWQISQDDRPKEAFGITLFPTTSADPIIAGYVAAVTDNDDVRYDDPAIIITTPVITNAALDRATAEEIFVFISDAGVVTDLLDNDLIITVVMNKTPANARDVRVYSALYVRAAGGAETLIKETATSGLIDGTPIEQNLIFSNVTANIDVSDRIVVKSFGFKDVSGGTNPAIEAPLGGLLPSDTPARLKIPQSLSTGAVIAVLGGTDIDITGTATSPIVNYVGKQGVLTNLKSSFTFDNTAGALTWATQGNSFALAGLSSPSCTAMANNRVAVIDSVDENLRMLEFDDTDWLQIGNALNIPGIGSPKLASLSSTDVALADGTLDTLGTYRFDGADWAQVGSDFSIATSSIPAITSMSRYTIALYDTVLGLRKLSFVDEIWAQVGSALAIATPGSGAIAALSTTDIAFIDGTNDELRTYRILSTTWAQIGSGLSVTQSSVPALAALSSIDVSYANAGEDLLQTYRWNGSAWATLGSSLSIAGVGGMGMAGMTSARIAIVNGSTDVIQAYDFAADTNIITDVTANGKLDPLVYEGATINVSDTASNDGAYTISSITDNNNVEVGEPIIDEVAVTSTISIQINDGDQVVGDTDELVVRP